MKESVKVSDNELIGRYLSGDVRGMEMLVNRYKNRLYAYIRMLVGNTDVVDDIFQDTFIKVVQMIRTKSYRDEGKFYHWITTIARNVVIDMYRKSKHDACDCANGNVDSLASDTNNVVKSIEDVMIENFNKQQLSLLIDMLPVEQSEVVRKRIYLDMSFKEIADESGVSINTALGRMRYALINLRRLLKEKNISLLQ